MVSRVLVFAYGLVCYLVFFLSFLYAIAFVGDLPVPRTVDSGPSADRLTALLFDLPLLALFAIQHSVMARQGFKRWWTKLVPPAAERSTYVLAASVALIALYAFWRPMPGVVWDVTSVVWREVLTGLFYLGFAVVLISTFLIDHFELFGLRQVWANLRGEEIPAPEFRTPVFYRLVRHPIYFGFLVAFWSTPHMTEGHLLFSIGTTGYIVLGMLLEERDLVRMFGAAYTNYRLRVPMLIPFTKLPRKAESKVREA